MQDPFRTLASRVAALSGTAVAFICALALIITWAATGPIFHFSDTWQLFINTTTTITTFLMVFLIQNTQNRDSRAMHLKMDELIRVTKGARENLVDAEEITDTEMAQLEDEYRRLRQRADERMQRRAMHLPHPPQVVK